MNLESVTLENGNKYVVIKEIEKYLYLSNPDNPDDFIIRKCVKDGDQEYIESLDSKEEFDEAIKLFDESEEE